MAAVSVTDEVIALPYAFPTAPCSGFGRGLCRVRSNFNHLRISVVLILQLFVSLDDKTEMLCFFKFTQCFFLHVSHTVSLFKWRNSVVHQWSPTFYEETCYRARCLCPFAAWTHDNDPNAELVRVCFVRKIFIFWYCSTFVVI